MKLLSVSVKCAGGMVRGRSIRRKHGGDKKFLLHDNRRPILALLIDIMSSNSKGSTVVGPR